MLKKNAWLVALALVMIAGGRGAGQAITPESLTVVVSDYGGTPIADASVVLTNEATGVTMELRTDASGKCMESLEPGHYKVAVEAPGFAPFRMADLAASAGDTLPVKLRPVAHRVGAILPEAEMAQAVYDPTANGGVQKPQTEFVRVGVNAVLGPMGYVATPAMTGTSQVAGANSEAALASRNFNFPSIVLYISSSPLVYTPADASNKTSLDKIRSAQETTANPEWLDASFTLIPKDAGGNTLTAACKDGSVQVLGILPQQTAAGTHTSAAVDAMTAANDAAGALASFYPGASAAASSATKAMNVVFGDIFPPKPIAFQYSYLSGNCDFGWFFRPNLNASTGTGGAASILGLQTGIILLKTTRDIAQIQVVGRTLSKWSKAPSTYSKELFASVDTLPPFVLPASGSINFDEISDLSAFPAMIAKKQAMAIVHVTSEAEWQTLIKTAPLVTTPSGEYVTNASLSAFLTAKAPVAVAGGVGAGGGVPKPAGGAGGKGSAPGGDRKPVKPAAK